MERYSFPFTTVSMVDLFDTSEERVTDTDVCEIVTAIRGEHEYCEQCGDCITCCACSCVRAYDSADIRPLNLPSAPVTQWCF
jgi:hypothetical protein